MKQTREYFSSVRKTVKPRPKVIEEIDVLGQKGSVMATRATIFGDNWYHDYEQGLIEVYDAGAALSFRDLLPLRNKYRREGLYLNLALAYRTTENANANIRTFSGNHVTLPNSVEGTMFFDPYTFDWVTEDMTINVNSIFSGEKLWIQRVDWEWVSKEIVYEDEMPSKELILRRTKDDIEKVYRKKEITDDTVKDYLTTRITKDSHFAKRCLALLKSDCLLEQDLPSLFKDMKLENQEEL